MADSAVQSTQISTLAILSYASSSLRRVRSARPEIRYVLMDETRTDPIWGEVLDPKILRPRLISASVYLAAYEMLKQSIIGRLEAFFTFSFDANGPVIDASYKEKVLSHHRKPLEASILWLVEHCALDHNDQVVLEQLTLCRNRLAHDISRLALAEKSFRHLELFSELVTVLNKIQTWWIRNFEIAMDEDFDGVEIKDEEIVPGRTATVRMLLQIALGSEEEANAYLHYFKEQSTVRHP